jgi:hypothetical protein
VVLRIELADSFEGQALNPEAILQCLRHDVPRRAFLFQLDHMQVALPVDGEQVDALAEIGDDLPADLEEVAQAEDVDARLDDLLQALFARNPAARHLLNRAVPNPPQAELHWHGDELTPGRLARFFGRIAPGA